MHEQPERGRSCGCFTTPVGSDSLIQPSKKAAPAPLPGQTRPRELLARFGSEGSVRLCIRMTEVAPPPCLDPSGSRTIFTASRTIFTAFRLSECSNFRIRNARRGKAEGGKCDLATKVTNFVLAPSRTALRIEAPSMAELEGWKGIVVPSFDLLRKENGCGDYL